MRTTIALNKSTKAELSRIKAPGQCYDGFLRQLIEAWENSNAEQPEACAENALGSTRGEHVSAGTSQPMAESGIN